MKRVREKQEKDPYYLKLLEIKGKLLDQQHENTQRYLDLPIPPMNFNYAPSGLLTVRYPAPGQPTRDEFMEEAWDFHDEIDNQLKGITMEIMINTHKRMFKRKKMEEEGINLFN